eukprot:5447500-Alexandrium_andersonii.AAC.1
MALDARLQVIRLHEGPGNGPHIGGRKQRRPEAEAHEPAHGVGDRAHAAEVIDEGDGLRQVRQRARDRLLLVLGDS